ncbi:glucan 1,4-alpha-glucosidase [Motilibacter aurantiacus]|uniref:glucan 1,4-alpha-glucosidase n=1 Tax=Motilibacter aurantiacus TaxID=2714955 RepID=UPI0014098FC3|nr:glucan 1,4-alpha-glucosidase [Motilibacter aurantiacus]NHC47543.1 glucan 1,4-alpha-glucosidase [Motilibacter aurantiacus]
MTTKHPRTSTAAVAAAGLAASLLAAYAAPASAATGTAPGAPGADATWTTGAKTGVGTSTTLASKVWYTLADGVLTEVYYPRVDVADSRSLELIVTDGRTFAESEATATDHVTGLADDRGLVYRQVNTDKDGRYAITKTYVTDPARSTVMVNVEFRSLDGGRYQVYARFDPALANSGRHDRAWTSGGALLAEDSGGADEVASALVADKPFLATSNGYVGTSSDGWEDLRADFDLDDAYGEATDGNVVQVARLQLGGTARTSTAALALGFGATSGEALATARASQATGFWDIRRAYSDGWHDYLGSLAKAPKSVRRDHELYTQYRVAAMQLKAHEDKTYRGANIASLTVPWGEAQNANEAGVGGYHLVWARDLYQVATAQLAAGDVAAANRSLDYLFDVQQRPDGSFPQNTLLDGTPYWQSLQLDEVAFPIVLAWQLGRTDADSWGHVKRSADFLVGRGPSTPQERWEEEGGWSPSTIAAEIAGLVAAADIARANGDGTSAVLYTAVADEWQRKVESWTYTTTGPLGDGRYYERIDDNGNPDDGAALSINNGGGTWDEREVVDAGFLELVRLGVKPWNDPYVTSSLPEVDSTIRVQTPNGAMWYRYNHDGYGEKADGSPYTGEGVGRLWPLLSGERGEYELAAGRPADSHLRTMAAAANEGYLIPEQVWDRPEATAYGHRFGEGTGSATPLAWSMAQYVRLALSIDAGRPVETPSVVADRYARGAVPAGPTLSLTSPVESSVTDRPTVTVTGTTDATSVFVNIGTTTTPVPVVDGSFSYAAPVVRGANAITVVAVAANGGTSIVTRNVTSNNFGTPLGGVDDPSGDDNGPGTYVYPADAAYNAGAFDITRFAVFDDGTSYNFVTTIRGDIRNPWGGNSISVQRLNVYVRTGTGAGAVPALTGTNARLAAPYDVVVTGEGFSTPTVQNAAGGVVATGSLQALPVTRQIAVSIPKSAFGAAGLASASYAVAIMSRADAGEGAGNIRPVYALDYWQSTAGTGMSWIHDHRFGGGAGVWTDAGAARDTDTRDPNVLDILTPPGVTQASALSWSDGVPATLPYVTLG